MHSIRQFINLKTIDLPEYLDLFDVIIYTWPRQTAVLH